MKLYLVTVNHVWEPKVIEFLAFRKEQVMEALEKQGYRVIGFTCTEHWQ